MRERGKRTEREEKWSEGVWSKVRGRENETGRESGEREKERMREIGKERED